MIQPMELLAPAGNMDALYAAIRYGADAVYLGLGRFNARQRASNFDELSLPEAVALCHDHGVRVYATLNTLIFDDEFDAVFRDADVAVCSACDALIVQDIGLAKKLRERFPDVPLHASTQMTLSDAAAINRLHHDLNLQRVILPREISLTEIHTLSKATTVELEMFVHGALCISYSGLCTASRFMGGRSANRGECAQPCRLPYQLKVDEIEIMPDARHWLSPKDLCLIDRIPELLTSGVRSLKIEGRLKSAEYVAAVTSCYRRALDAALAGETLPDSVVKDAALLPLSFARTPGCGYIDGDHHHALVDDLLPGKTGVKVGRVIRQDRYRIYAKLDQPLCAGDGVAFGIPDSKGRRTGGRIFSVQTPSGDGITELSLYRTDSHEPTPALGKDIPVWLTSRQTWTARWDTGKKGRLPYHKHTLHFVLTVTPGQVPELEGHDPYGHVVKRKGEQQLEMAHSRPLTLDKVTQQLNRLGESSFVLGTVTLTDGHAELNESPVMLPVSVINQLRREVCESIQRLLFPDRIAIDSSEKVQITPVPPAQSPLPRLSIVLRKTEQLVPLLNTLVANHISEAVITMDYSDNETLVTDQKKIKDAGFLSAVTTPRAMLDQYIDSTKKIVDIQPDIVLIRSLGAYELCRIYAPNCLYIGDSSLNIVNSETAAFWINQGIQRLIPGEDLSENQLMKLVDEYPERWEIPVYMHPLFFYTQYCLNSVHAGNGKGYPLCGKVCRNHQLTLIDRKGLNMSVMRDAIGRQQILGQSPENRWNTLYRIPKNCALRIEFLDENVKNIENVIQNYVAALSNR